VTAASPPHDALPTWRARVEGALGLFVVGTLGWLAVCSVELRDLQLGVAYGWIAIVHLLRVASWFALAGTAAVLALGAVRSTLASRTRHPERLTALLLAAFCAPFAWQTADALLGGGMFGDSESAQLLAPPIALALCVVYVACWLVHRSLWRVPGRTWPAWMARALTPIPARVRLTTLWLATAAVLVLLVEAIDHQLRAYMFVARYLLPAAWLLAATLIGAVVLWLPRVVRRVLGVLSLAAVIAAFAIQPPARALSKVRNDIARLAGAASLSDVSAQKQRDAQLAALDFSKPHRFDCDASVRMLPASPRPASQRNVILISVDTLRKDAVDSMHDGEKLMPNLSRFARRSIRFERAVTSYPATLFAVGGALTGLSPSEVLFAPDVPDNVITQAKHAVDVRHIFLPEYFWFRKASIRKLFQQSTPTVFGLTGERSTDSMIDALTAARKKKQRVFAWLHYYEPHLPPETKTPAARQEMYREQLRYTDLQLGRLLRALDKLDYYQDSLVLLFSDHGEALGEFGFIGHHVYLNHFLTDIPLLMRVPGQQARRDARIASVADIAPTIQQWLGLPMRRTDARSLLEPAPPNDTRYVVSEAFPLRGSALFSLARTRITSVRALEKRVATVRTSAVDYSPKVAITTARYRLIVDRDSGAEQLYDREHDPEEKHNLADEGLPVHALLKRELAAWAVGQSESIYCAVTTARR
jgi:arylsulfatase A-like enzyme